MGGDGPTAGPFRLRSVFGHRTLREGMPEMSAISLDRRFPLPLSSREARLTSSSTHRSPPVKRFAVALASVGALLALPAPASALDLDPVRLQLVDVPATVPAGSDSSVGAFVPRGARCRLVLRDAAAAVIKGPGARAASGFMQFP